MNLNIVATASDICQRNDFFGLRPWYHYLPSDHFDGCDIRQFHLLPGNGSNDHSDVPLVLLAVIDDLLRIAALIAVGFIIVGAVQLITSQGNPDDASKARTTIINALLGLAIAVTAVAFVSFLGSKIG